MKIVALKKEHFKIWNDLVRSTNGTGFMQSWEWSEFKESCGVTVDRIGVFDAESLVAGAMVYRVDTSIGVSPLTVPHGPVLPWENSKKSEEYFGMIKKQLEILSARTGSPVARIEPFICFLPDFMGNLTRSPLDLVPTPTLMIELGKTDEELLSSMTQKGRYNVRLSLRKGVEVISCTDNSLTSEFYELFEITCSRHNFTGEPLGFFQKLMDALGPAGMSRVYLATYKGMKLASTVAVFFGDRATYLYGGTSPFLRSTMASYALHWRMIQDARDRGFKFYDLYGVAPENEPFHPYARFSAFKSRFGGNLVRTVGAQDIYFYPQLAKTLVSHLSSTPQVDRSDPAKTLVSHLSAH